MANRTKSLLNIIAETEFGKAVISKKAAPHTLDLSYMYMPSSDIEELEQILSSSIMHPIESSNKSFWGLMVNKIKSFTKTFQKEKVFKEEFLKHKSEIITLNLSNIFYTDDRNGEFDPKSLIKLLSLPQLQNLDLSHNAFVTSDVAKNLVLEAIKHPNVKHLCLKSNKLDGDWILSIIEELGKINHTLTIELKTVGTQIPDSKYEKYSNIVLEGGTLYCNRSELLDESVDDTSATEKDLDLGNSIWEVEVDVLESKEIPPDSESLASFKAWEELLNEELLGNTPSAYHTSSEA